MERIEIVTTENKIKTKQEPEAQSPVSFILVNDISTRRLTESGQIRYFCPQCNVRYVKFKYLKTHLKDCGNEFKCDTCSSTFKQRRTFVLHMKEKHGTLVKIETVVPSPKTVVSSEETKKVEVKPEILETEEDSVVE